MHGNLSVVAESSGDRQGGERTAETVDKHVDLLALVFGEGFANRRGAEVVSAEVTFQGYVVSGFRHGELRITPRSYRYI